MNVTVSSSSDFKPVTLSITFTNKREMNMFATLFNYTPIYDYFAISNIRTDDIRNKLREFGADPSDTYTLNSHVRKHPAITDPHF